MATAPAGPPSSNSGAALESPAHRERAENARLPLLQPRRYVSGSPTRSHAAREDARSTDSACLSLLLPHIDSSHDVEARFGRLDLSPESCPLPDQDPPV